MNKKKQNVSFQSLTDWLQHNGSHPQASKGIEKILKKDSIQDHIKANKEYEDTVAENDFSSSQNSQPDVKLIKEGDVVSGIQVTCVCGKIIHIDLEYDEETNSLIYKNNNE